MFNFGLPKMEVKNEYTTQHNTTQHIALHHSSRQPKHMNFVFYEVVNLTKGRFKRHLVLLLLCLSLIQVYARPNLQKWCVCLKRSTTSTSCDAMATEYTAGANPCNLYDYYEWTGSTKSYFNNCNAYPVNLNTTCNVKSTATYNNLWDYVDASGQQFGIKGICTATGDTVNIFDFTDSIPSNWNSFGTVLITNSDGSLTVTLYQTQENAEIDIMNMSNNNAVSFTISSEVMNAQCSSEPENLNRNIYRTPKLLFDLHPNPSDGSDVKISINNPAVFEAKTNVLIFNSSGQLVLTMLADRSEIVLAKNMLSPGTYYVTLQNDIQQKTIPLFITSGSK